MSEASDNNTGHAGAPLPEHGRRRTSGALHGAWDNLYPCIYLATRDRGWRAFGTDIQVYGRGLFSSIGKVTHEDGDAVTAFTGLILPVSLCRNEQTRTSLKAMATLVQGLRQLPLSERRELVARRLYEAFGDDLRLSKHDTLDGFIWFDISRELFRRLHDEFEYVTEVVDGRDGVVHITQSEPFRWSSAGALMEWYHNATGGGDFGCWTSLMPFFVGSGVEHLEDGYIVRSFCSSLVTPKVHPGRWFRIRPDVQNAEVSFHFSMDDIGSVELQVSVGTENFYVQLSYVGEPFDDLLAWGREVGESDQPAEIHIDEEGSQGVLTVLRTDDPDRVLFRYVGVGWKPEPRVEAIVSRVVLANALKTELKRFFTDDFVPREWDTHGEAEDNDNYKSTLYRVLNHPWLNG